MDQFTRLDMPNLDEARLECEDIRIVQRKGLWCSFPRDFPVLSCTPAIAVDKETEIRVIEKEFTIQSLDMDRFDVFPPRHKVK